MTICFIYKWLIFNALRRNSRVNSARFSGSQGETSLTLLWHILLAPPLFIVRILHDIFFNFLENLIASDDEKKLIIMWKLCKQYIQHTGYFIYRHHPGRSVSIPRCSSPWLWTTFRPCNYVPSSLIVSLHRHGMFRSSSHTYNFPPAKALLKRWVMIKYKVPPINDHQIDVT